MKNPFQVIGVSPEALKGLNDKEIQEVIGSTYRALQKIYHPEGSRPNEKKNRELTEAREALDMEKNREQYLNFKDAFLRPGLNKRRIEELEGELALCNKQIERYSARVGEYVTRIICESMGKDKLPMDVTALRSISLTIGDVVKSMNLRAVNTFRRQGKCSIEIDGNGNIGRGDGKNITPVPSTKLFGCIQEKEQELFREIYKGLMKKRIEKIGIGAFDATMFQERVPIRKTCSLEEFMKFSYLVSPFITRRAYLFSITVSEDKDPTVNFEGQLLSEPGSFLTAT